LPLLAFIGSLNNLLGKKALWRRGRDSNPR
jgi:hypothetical protein